MAIIRIFNIGDKGTDKDITIRQNNDDTVIEPGDDFLFEVTPLNSLSLKEVIPQEIPVAPAAEPDDLVRAALAASVARLDKLDPSHWTKDGHADVTVLSEWLGIPITRAYFDAVYPDLRRPAAA